MRLLRVVLRVKGRHSSERDKRCVREAGEFLDAVEREVERFAKETNAKEKR